MKIPEYMDAIHSVIQDIKRLSDKNIADPGFITEKNEIYYSQGFRHRKPLSQMVFQMSECFPEE
jgi:hypothetical protein